MRRKPPQNLSCPHPKCTLHGQFRKQNIVRHGYFALKRGRRRRYRCKACGRTFASALGTAYYGLQYPRKTFDEVADLRSEGVSISTIARVKRLSWNTVARWLERAAAHAREFNDHRTQGYEINGLQADEIRTFVHGKAHPIWIMATIEVWSRLWPASVVGRRSSRNTALLIRDTVRRGWYEHAPLLTSDGFQYYDPVIWRAFGFTCVYGQVMKGWANNRVTRVERRLLIGSPSELDEALSRSEDSSDLNTSFIERMNLTIRQGSAYLCRRSPCHARSRPRLEDHIELLRCYYNFVRPHRGLKFGKEIRTPAMQAGLASRADCKPSASADREAPALGSGDCLWHTRSERC